MKDHIDEVRRYLTDPDRLCRSLGLTKGSVKAAGGLKVLCPSHSERTPSCSVTTGPDGTVRVKCFGCDLAGDGFVLVAAVLGLDYRRDFTEVLASTAELVGLQDGADEIRYGRPAAEGRPLPEPPTAQPEKVYPPKVQVLVLWNDAGFTNEDPEASRVLVERMIDPDVVTVRDLARVIRVDQVLPRWARYRGGAEESNSWLDTGHRLLLPVYDSEGIQQSVRAWRIRSGDTPKRLPPSGHKANGLVLANHLAVGILQGNREPQRIIISEGESDYLTWAARASVAVIGIYSGSWSAELAKRIPLGSDVIVRTDLDEAGERYAKQIISTLMGRCELRRTAA